MAQTESTMLALGTPAPEFTLPDSEGNTVSINDFKGKDALLVMFICNHCPFVKHLEQALGELGKEYQARNVGIVAICSNDQDNYPDDHPDKLREQKKRAGFSFPYLVDADQSVAKAYKAACTPDFYVFNKNRELAYRGQFDGTRPTRHGPGDYESQTPATGADLRAALDAVIEGSEPPADQTPSIGCNIKWKPGNEPAYVTA